MRSFTVAMTLGLVLAGCSSMTSEEPAPDGVGASLMQYRGDRLTRHLAVAFTNDSAHAITIDSMRFTSNRLSEPITWKGAEEIDAGYGSALDITPTAGTCGATPTNRAEITYRWNGQQRRSTVAVPDPYDVFGSLMDGDCGEQAFDAAVAMDVGVPQVRGDLWSTALTLTPRPNGPDVTLLGFAPTLKFAFGPRTPTEVEMPLDRPQTVHLDVVMGRCDPHIAAEDKVGSRFGLRVRTADIDEAYFTLPLDDAIRASLDDFYAQRCVL